MAFVQQEATAAAACPDCSQNSAGKRQTRWAIAQHKLAWSPETSGSDVGDILVAENIYLQLPHLSEIIHPGCVPKKHGPDFAILSSPSCVIMLKTGQPTAFHNFNKQTILLFQQKGLLRGMRLLQEKIFTKISSLSDTHLCSNDSWLGYFSFVCLSQ